MNWMHLGKRFTSAPLKERIKVAWLAIKGESIPYVTKLFDENIALKNGEWFPEEDVD